MMRYILLTSLILRAALGQKHIIPEKVIGFGVRQTWVSILRLILTSWGTLS